MEPISLVIIVLLGLLTIAVLIAFNQLSKESKEIRELEKSHERITKHVSQSDADLFQRWKRQQKDLGNLASDFEQFKLNYGAALEYNRESFLVIQREESKRKAEEGRKAKEAEKEARVKAFTEKVLDALSKTISDEKLTAEEASTLFENELSFLVATYMKDAEVDVIIPDSAYLYVGEICIGHLEDEHGRIIV